MSWSESRAVTQRQRWAESSGPSTVSGYDVKRKQLIVAVENFLSETFVCRELRSSCGQ